MVAVRGAVVSVAIFACVACGGQGEKPASATTMMAAESAMPPASVTPSAGMGGMAVEQTPSTPPAERAMPSATAGTGGASVADPAGSAMEPAMEEEPPSGPMANEPVGVGRIYWLDILGNRVLSAAADGSGQDTIASTLTAPDGVSVDPCGQKVYWSNMGNSLGAGQNASVQRADLDGAHVETLVERGSGVNTGKQLQLDLVNGKVYFSDREGAKIWRMNLDGSERETVVSGHGFDQLVGVAVDPAGGYFYFTDRNRGLVLRAGIEFPPGEDHASRGDVETLADLGSASMPIDLALDLGARELYLTDRRKGTVSVMGMDVPPGQSASARDDVRTLVDGLADPIGISLDLEEGALYFTELGGAVSRAALDGSDSEVIAHSDSATGIAFVRVSEDGSPLCP